jgi:predicted RNA methylase
VTDGSRTAWIDALLSPQGERLLDELAREAVEPHNELRVITRFRARYDADLVANALAQIKLRARARSKFSHADRMLFTAAGLEQASSERMATHHARRFASFSRMADLCSGIGGDLIGLAAERGVIAVDYDEVHSRLGAVNAAANGVGPNVTSVCADVRDISLADIPAVFIDPARRNADRRFRAGASEPPLDWCWSLAARGISVGIKAAPGLPVDRVPEGWEVEFASEGRELKESVLWSPGLATAARRATLLASGESITADEHAQLSVREPGDFLLDPDPAVTRAGLVEELGEQLGHRYGECWKIDDQVAFISSNVALVTAFGRALRVEASMPWNLKRVKEALSALDVGSVDIRKRGSAVDVDEVQRRLKLEGQRAMTLVLTRVRDRPWAFICSSVSSQG